MKKRFFVFACLLSSLFGSESLAQCNATSAPTWSSVGSYNAPVISVTCTNGPNGTYNVGTSIPVSAYASSCQLTLYASGAQNYAWSVQNASSMQIYFPASTTTGANNTLIFSGTPGSGSFAVEVRASNCFGYALPDRVRFIFYLMGASRAMAYPNPAASTLNVQFPNSVLTSKASAPKRVILYDSQMQAVRRQEVAATRQIDPTCSCSRLALNVHGLAKGKYYLHIEYANNKIEKSQIALE